MKKFKKNIALILAVLMLINILPIHAEAATIKVNKTKASVYVGQSTQLKLKGTSKKAKWSSNKKSVATVNSKGKVTGKKAGVAVISAKVGKKYYKCRVTVKNNNTQHNYQGNYNNTQLNDNSQVYKDIIAMKSQYPEGTTWTNDKYYAWKGGVYFGGFGCAGFAFMLSDAAFGNLPARKHTNFSDIKVGDVLRMNNDTHSVIVLEINDDNVIVAEGNYNNKYVHWGRKVRRSEIQKTGDYVMTRYAE